MKSMNTDEHNFLRLLELVHKHDSYTTNYLMIIYKKIVFVAEREEQ